MSEILAAVSRKLERKSETVSSDHAAKDAAATKPKAEAEPFLDRSLLPVDVQLVPLEALADTSASITITSSKWRIARRMLWPIALMLAVCSFVFGMVYMVRADGGASSSYLLLMFVVAAFVAWPSVRYFFRALVKATRSLHVTFSDRWLIVQQRTLSGRPSDTVQYTSYSGIRHDHASTSKPNRSAYPLAMYFVGILRSSST
ncbi:MAG: hypothetical protein AAFY01_04950, partial [Pseudomonadota bacterium]